MPGAVGSVDHLALLSGLTRIGKWLLAQPDCRCSNCSFVPQNCSRGARSDRGCGLDLSCSRQSATLRPAGRWSGFALAGRRVAATAGWPDRGRFPTYYLRQCVRRPFEPTPRLRSRKDRDNASPEQPRGWRIAEQGNRGSAAVRGLPAPTGIRVKLEIAKADAIPSQKYRKLRVLDCPDRETQSRALAFPAVSRACGLHELSGRSNLPGPP
jgi:hypothetical protein